MFAVRRFPLLLACLVSVTILGCSTEIKSFSPTLSPEKQKEVKDFMAQGNQKLSDGEYQAAIANFDQALAIDQNNAKVLGYRGVARSRLQDYQGALEDYNQALAIDSEAYKVYYNRGLVQTNLNNHESAIADFTEAIEQKPDFARAIGNRGFAHAELENYTAAIKDLEKAAAIFKERGKQRTSYRLQRAARYIQP